MSETHQCGDESEAGEPLGLGNVNARADSRHAPCSVVSTHPSRVSLLEQSIAMTKLVPHCRDVSKACERTLLVVSESNQCRDGSRRGERDRIVVSEAHQRGDERERNPAI